jgi:hypothetical protein
VKGCLDICHALGQRKNNIREGGSFGWFSEFFLVLLSIRTSFPFVCVCVCVCVRERERERKREREKERKRERERVF